MPVSVDLPHMCREHLQAIYDMPVDISCAVQVACSRGENASFPNRPPRQPKAVPRERLRLRLWKVTLRLLPSCRHLQHVARWATM